MRFHQPTVPYLVRATGVEHNYTPQNALFTITFRVCFIFRFTFAENAREVFLQFFLNTCFFGCHYVAIYLVDHVLCFVTNIVCNILFGDVQREHDRNEIVPLRYNNDKPEKPRIARVFGYQARFFILFQTEKSSQKVVIS